MVGFVLGFLTGKSRGQLVAVAGWELLPFPVILRHDSCTLCPSTPPPPPNTHTHTWRCSLYITTTATLSTTPTFSPFPQPLRSPPYPPFSLSPTHTLSHVPTLSRAPTLSPLPDPLFYPHHPSPMPCASVSC